MRTFLDSGVLLTAWKGKIRDRDAALSVMEDATREFHTGYMVKLELLPKPMYFKQEGEVEFYRAHWERVRKEEPLTAEVALEAFELAKRYGLAAADALNLAAAIRLDVQEFITSELPGKPLFRAKEIKVTSLHTIQPAKGSVLTSDTRLAGSSGSFVPRTGQ